MTIRGGFMGRLQGGDQQDAYRLRDLDRQALRTLWRLLAGGP